MAGLYSDDYRTYGDRGLLLYGSLDNELNYAIMLNKICYCLLVNTYILIIDFYKAIT